MFLSLLLVAGWAAATNAANPFAGDGTSATPGTAGVFGMIGFAGVMLAILGALAYVVGAWLGLHDPAAGRTPVTPAPPPATVAPLFAGIARPETARTLQSVMPLFPL